jgi:hypothetical protein
VASFEVAPGETVRCTFTNTKDGRIEVEKQTLPDGDPETFGFTGDITDILGDGDVAGVAVAPGQYSVTELAEAGWNLTGIVCSDSAGSSPSSGNVDTRIASYVVDPGETVRCTFTNTEIPVTTTTVGGPSTTTTTIGGPCDPSDPDCLPNTGGGRNLLWLLLGGLGLLFLGVGVLMVADERRRRLFTP